MAAVTPGHDHDDGGYGLNVLKRLRTPTKVRESSHPRRTAEENFADMAKESDVDQAIELAVQRWKRRAKITFVVVAVCLVVAAIVDLACHDNVRGWLEDSFDWIEENPEAGVVVFALIFCVATLLFVPGLILTVGAGVAFGRALGFGLGLLFGSIAVLAGAFAACVIAFYLGRYVLHDQAQRCAKRYRILGAVNTAIETNGIKVMVLLRLSPLVPFSGFNLIAGLTKVSLKEYLIGCMGIIPGTVAFVFIGASTAGTMAEEEAMSSGEADRTACIIRMVLLIVGICAAVIALVAVTIYGRRALKQALMDAELEETKTEMDDVKADSESSVQDEFKEPLETMMIQDDVEVGRVQSSR